MRWKTKTTIVVFILLAACVTRIAAAAAEPATLPTARELLPILAWSGPPADQTTAARYRELADAGFTHNFSSYGTVDAVMTALDVAQAAGVKQIIGLDELTGPEPAPVVKRIKDHPALGGYYVRDEPAAGDFTTVAAQVKRIAAVDDRHPCYVNLFPNYATPDQLGAATYGQYVDRFLAEVPVPLVSFDHYPVINTGGGRIGLRGEWYENLEIVSAAARKTGKPMWAFALAVAHGAYPVPTVAQLRVQVFSDLAYGAEAIEYFTYWTPPQPSPWDFHQGPITSDGKRTDVYDRVKQVNGEIQGLRGVFLGAKVLSIAHTGRTIPRGTRAYQPAAPVKGLKTGDGGGAVVASLANGAWRFLVVVNRDVNAAAPLEVELDGSAAVHRVQKDGSLSPRIDGPRVETQLDAGDVCILAWLEGR
jgi:hypothetical protein